MTKERVVEAAAQFIERSGAADFSMRALAESLDIQTASLYDHVESMDALMAAVCALLRKKRETLGKCGFLCKTSFEHARKI